MNNYFGKNINIYLTNGLRAYGRLVDYTKEQAVLKTDASANLLVIRNPEDNILMFQVLLDEMPSQTFQPPKVPEEVKEQAAILVKDSPEEVKNLAAKRLVELKEIQKKQEVEALTAEMKKFNNQAPQEKYELPSFKYNSNEKSSRSNAAKLRELRGMR